ncbi:TPA: hypothetical protein HA265_02720 [Candidatus Woesearchaeota archaeon]|nr:hypothetical protein [Candidatus Woesearchaeota archaeon]
MTPERAYVGKGISGKDAGSFDSYISSKAHASGSEDSLLYGITRKAIEGCFTSPFSDVTDRLVEDTYRSVSSITPDYGGRKEMLDTYRKERLNYEVIAAKGNLTEVTRRLHGVTDPDKVNNLRRNVYRNVDLDMVNYARPWKQQQSLADSYKNPLSSETIESTLRSSLSSYRENLHPNVYNDLSEQISRYSPQLAEDLGRYVQTNQNLVRDWVDQTKGMTLQDSMQYVERNVIMLAFENAGFDKAKAAKYLKDSRETLNRRIRELGLKEELESAERKKQRVDGHRKPTDVASAKPVVSDVDRMRELIAEKQRSLEAEAQRPRKTKQKKVDFPVFEEYLELAA